MKTVAEAPPHAADVAAAVRRFESDPAAGLTSAEVTERLTRYGPNTLPEAAGRSVVAAIGLKSNALLPLKAGGQVLGALGVDHLTVPCSWPPDLVSRLELLASVYAQALYRRRARQRLQRTQDLNRSVLASVASEIVLCVTANLTAI